MYAGEVVEEADVFDLFERPPTRTPSACWAPSPAPPRPGAPTGA